MKFLLRTSAVFVLFTTCLCDVSQLNQYLPPSKGYNYDKPNVPFPSINNNQQVPYPTTARPFTPPKTTYGPPPTPSYRPPSPSTSYRPPPPTQPPYRPPQPQYNPPPQPTYGPPPTPNYNGEQTIHHDDHHHHHEPGMPFDFNYAVKDDYYGNDYAHNAVSDGDVTRGEYRILLPDGRTQIVRYTADWKNGFNAQVTYEGTAKYPDQPQGQGSGLNPTYGAPTSGGYKY